MSNDISKNGGETTAAKPEKYTGKIIGGVIGAIVGGIAATRA